MISLKFSTKPLWDNKVEGYFFLLNEGFSLSSDMNKIKEDCYPKLEEIFKRHKFEGKKDQSFVLTGTYEGELVQFFFIGLGKLNTSWENVLEHFRRTIGTLVSSIKKYEINTSVLSLPSSDNFGIDSLELLKQSVITAHMADYEFSDFKSAENKNDTDKILYLISPDIDDSSARDVLKEADIIGKQVNFARHLDDLPGNMLTPKKLAEKAKDMASKTGLKFSVFGRDKAEKLGMGGFCAVDIGSEEEGQFIVLEHKVSNNVPTVVLVGKGVTFDTGGISLKPANYMTGMKYDMSGAGAVIAALGAIGHIKPNVNVIGIAPAVENMPSGKCSRQDDIITFMNGKTAEIANTDAEGRLILADALCYAEKNYNPDVIIDIATLTGACVVALGHFFTAVMSRDNSLVEKLVSAGNLSGDRLWQMPLHDDYKVAIKSKVADLSNCGSPEYSAGTITAGHFLENFVEKTPWAHLDIAGTADRVPGVNFLRSGATGVGVRLFVEFVKNI
ncbi:leucyl aminopeptidase [Candidatus Babeliales bacterium]|nr:leucyl aminopeptidase [Candidatus Babeliales bacterium]